MKAFELDGYCLKILLVLIGKRQARFNELYNLLNNMKIELSKPTLSDHLKHLVEDGYVRRQVEGLQQVTYAVDYDKIGKIDKFSKQAKAMERLFDEDTKEFFSLPETEQVEHVLWVNAMIKLNEIPARIELELNPESFENQLSVMLWNSRRLDRYEVLMIRKCIEDEEYRKKVLKTMGDWLKREIIDEKKLQKV